MINLFHFCVGFGLARKGWGSEVLFGVWGDLFLVVRYFGVGDVAMMDDTIIREIAAVGFLDTGF